MSRYYLVEGFRNDLKNNDYFNKEELNVYITVDAIGATLSVGNDDTQFTIPFGKIVKDLIDDLMKGEE